MDDWQNIIDAKRHPIGELNIYTKNCSSELQTNGILVLKNFLTRNAINNLKREAHELSHKAFYCSQSHNVLLTEKNKQWNDAHPCNVEVVSDKGCVPHDLIPNDSYLKAIYDSDSFKRFICAVLSLDNIYPYADRLSSINYNYYQENQQLGWHFDNASFAITLMVQSSEAGGAFQYVSNARDVESNKIDASVIDAALQGSSPVKELELEEGSLVLFLGRNTLHRVTPVISKKPRILATLNYNLEKYRELSENARLAFFGRLH